MFGERRDRWSSRLLRRVEESQEPLNREIGFVLDGIMRIGVGRRELTGGDDQHTEPVFVVGACQRGQAFALRVAEADYAFATPDARGD